jgi:hypothetical protein
MHLKTSLSSSRESLKEVFGGAFWSFCFLRGWFDGNGINLALIAIKPFERMNVGFEGKNREREDGHKRRGWSSTPNQTRDRLWVIFMKTCLMNSQREQASRQSILNLYQKNYFKRR